MRRLVCLSLLLPWLAAGCGSLEVGLPGRLGTPAIVRESGPGGPLVWACDQLGNLTLNGRPLHLPTRSEGKRFGITVVDAGALPPAWRPDHAQDGGLLVTGLDKGSPFAIVGLRPLDRIVAVDGKPVATPDELVGALSVEPDAPVNLSAVDPDGDPVWPERRRPHGAQGEPVLEARAADGPRDSQVFRAPLLFERRLSSAGGSFGFGPLDSLFYWRAASMHGYDADPDTGHSTYTRRFEWGALLNLVLWERAVLPNGEERSRLRLFWFLGFGDDVP